MTVKKYNIKGEEETKKLFFRLIESLYEPAVVVLMSQYHGEKNCLYDINGIATILGKNKKDSYLGADLVMIGKNKSIENLISEMEKRDGIKLEELNLNTQNVEVIK